MKITIAEAEKRLNERRNRSAWDRGVTLYAFDLLDNLNDAITDNNRDPESPTEAREWMLNGARNWEQFSYGGSALVYDTDIAERLCTPSELKKTRNGDRIAVCPVAMRPDVPRRDCVQEIKNIR